MEKKWRFQCWSSEVVEFKITLCDFQESIKNGRKWLVNQFCYLLKSKLEKKPRERSIFLPCCFFFIAFFLLSLNEKKRLSQFSNLWICIFPFVGVADSYILPLSQPPPPCAHFPIISLLVHRQNQSDKRLNRNRLLHLFQA